MEANTRYNRTIEDGSVIWICPAMCRCSRSFYTKQSPLANKYLAIRRRHNCPGSWRWHWLKDLRNLGCRPVLVSGFGLGALTPGPPGFPEVTSDDFSRIGTWITHDLSWRPIKACGNDSDDRRGSTCCEFPCTANIHPSNFLRRNRIIGGSLGRNLVAESAKGESYGHSAWPCHTTGSRAS